MNIKILNLLLIVTSLFGYLEWGGSNHSFLFESEFQVLSGLLSNPESVIHPFTVIPLVGQILLLFTVFQRKPGKALTFIGIACIGVLLGFMLFVGLMALNYKIIISTIPYFIISMVTISTFKKS